MAIYTRCSACRRDNQPTFRICKGCGAKLGDKYLVRIKDNQSGKWNTKIVPTFKLAKEVETKLKVQQIEGSLFDKKLKDFISFNRYLAHAKLHKKSWKDDEQRWNKHIAGSNWRTKQGILIILNRMIKEGYQPATIHHVLKLIRRVYNWHIQNNLFHSSNPTGGILLPKYDNRKTNILSQEETKKFVEYLSRWRNRRAALVTLFALYTGRRRGEILNLTWDDISWENRAITCRNTKNGKTLSFPLNDKASSILKEAQAVSISSLVFPCNTGNHFYSFSSTWQRLRKRLGLTIRFHDLRHTYASHLASSGKVDIYTLKTLLGHKDISLTERYSHLSDDRLRKSTEVLDSLF